MYLAPVRVAVTKDVSPTIADPCIKWVGSKRWLVKKHAHLLPMPAQGCRAHIPFVGGGAVAFYYAARRCGLALSDANRLLVETHKALRDRPQDVCAILRAVAANGYTSQNFEMSRSLLNGGLKDPARVAAHFITINRWGFNGLWRVNGSGECNVSFGKPSKPGTVPVLCDETAIMAHSTGLMGAAISCSDFDHHVTHFLPQRGDVAYFDPPYVPASETASHTAYTVGGFGQADQDRLVRTLEYMDALGVRWALSNSDTEAARKLYDRPGWNILRLERSGAVSCDVEARGKVGEILVRNYSEAA